jgi:predicted transposase/invertase (TIGR01784 family)
VQNKAFTMGNSYDKIIRENIEEMIYPLASKVLNIKLLPDYTEEIPDDLQYTIERKPDFLKKIHTEEQVYILHIEFQSADDYFMPERMLVYLALLYQKYQVPIKQYVFFIGGGHSKMKSSISMPNLIFRFDLFNLSEIDYQTFVNSDKPEEVIFAILTNFGSDSPGKVISLILDRLGQLYKKGKRIGKYLKQLEILSKLRNLQEEIIKQITTMPIKYDLETDIRFLQGVEKGIAKGMEKGIEKGIEKAQKEIKKEKKGMILKMIKSELFKNGFITLEHIADFTNVKLEVVKKIKTEFDKKKNADK